MLLLQRKNKAGEYITITTWGDAGIEMALTAMKDIARQRKIATILVHQNGSLEGQKLVAKTKVGFFGRKLIRYYGGIGIQHKIRGKE